MPDAGRIFLGGGGVGWRDHFGILLMNVQAQHLPVIGNRMAEYIDISLKSA